MQRIVEKLWWNLNANRIDEAKPIANKIRKKLSRITEGVRLYHYNGFADFGVTLVGNKLTVDYNGGYGKFYITFEFEAE